MAHALPKHISIIYTYEVSTDTTYSSSDTWRLISMQKWSDLGPWCYCHAHSLTYIQKLTFWTRISTTCIDLSALKIWFVVQVLYMYHSSKNWIYWKCVGGGMRRRGHNFERPDMLKDPTRDSTVCTLSRTKVDKRAAAALKAPLWRQQDVRFPELMAPACLALALQVGISDYEVK